MNNEMTWYKFVEAGGLAKAGRRLEEMTGSVDADTLYWAFKRALCYTNYFSEEMLADAVAKRAASAVRREQREMLSLAKDLSGGLCTGVLV